jgi:cysteine synthase
VLDETINGVTVSRVADYATLRMTAIVPKTWEEQDAKNVRVMGSNLLLTDPVADAIDKGEFVW